MANKNKTPMAAGSDSGRRMILLAVFALLVGLFLLDYVNNVA